MTIQEETEGDIHMKDICSPREKSIISFWDSVILRYYIFPSSSSLDCSFTASESDLVSFIRLKRLSNTFL